MKQKGGEASDDLYNVRVTQRLSQDANNFIINSELNTGSQDAISSVTNNCNVDSYDSINYFYTFNRGGSSSMKKKVKDKDKDKDNNTKCDCKKKVSKGGCMTCPKGVENINVYFQTFHIIIPRLHKKYKSFKTKRIGGNESSAFLDLTYLNLTDKSAYDDTTYNDNSSSIVKSF